MKDPFLATLVKSVHENSLSFGITLITQGGVISGQMISTKEYFEDFANSIADAWPGGPSEDVRSGFAAWSEFRKKDDDEHDEFIHLKNARYVYGNQLTPNGKIGILWRGKLSEVTGFSLGACEVS
ncbi:gas vesicle accessory protein GvpU [Pseudomonas sp. 910_21]|uniref:gas vesicle accessory protein GvpU n=1 Tax=Pseudomonas sp. 910_21 TaxID=2604460 RepID=UPI0040634352